MNKESTHIGKHTRLFRIKFGSVLTKVGPIYTKWMPRMVFKATTGEMAMEPGLIGLLLTGKRDWMTNR